MSAFGVTFFRKQLASLFNQIRIPGCSQATSTRDAECGYGVEEPGAPDAVGPVGAFDGWNAILGELSGVPKVGALYRMPC